jgi:transposase
VRSEVAFRLFVLEEGPEVISKDTEARIIRLFFVEKWRRETIARELGIHHSVVRRVVERGGGADEPLPVTRRPSMIELYVPFLLETLGRYPRIAASRLYAMLRERGYSGGPDHVRHVVRGLRPRRSPEAFLRLSTLPGEEAQVDWGHFGMIEVGRARRQLMAFVMVLSYSRRIFLRFFPGQTTTHFLRGHVAAFAAFGAVPRRVLYDNLKSVVIDRRGDAIHFNPQLLEFSAYYRYEPRPVGIRRGNEKGRVERAIRYIREAFFTALTWDTLDELNEKARAFCEGTAMARPYADDRRRTVSDAFEEERVALMTLPGAPYPVAERVEVVIGKTPYARFEGNDYSVPHEMVGTTLTVVATMKSVRVLDGVEEVARHRRSFSKGERIDDPRHVRDLVRMKKRAHRGRVLDLLQRSVPASTEFLAEVARRNQNVGSATRLLHRILESYGRRLLAYGLKEAVDRGAFHPYAVRLAIERRLEEEQGSPVLPIALPDDPRVRLTVVPHELDQYDMEKNDDEEDDERVEGEDAAEEGEA